jgi:hypothetical protein
MTTQHTLVDMFAGDDWELRCTLLDEDGNPYNLAPMPNIQWALVDRNYKSVINGTDTIISVTDAALGQCSIFIPSEATTTLSTGIYTDILRITISGVTSTLASGSIHVTQDAFKIG